MLKRFKMTDKPSANSLLGIAGKPFAKLLGVLIVLVLAHLSGRAYQHFRAGHFYEEHEREELHFEDGKLIRKIVTESIGFPFFVTGTSIIEFELSPGFPITLYSARRIFQEAEPYVREVTIDHRNIRWEDGIYRYSLSLEPMEDDEQAAIGIGLPITEEPSHTTTDTDP